MGPNCTRSCTFCNVIHGKCYPPDHSEPKHIARAVALLGLRHAVITSVTRDDLADGGAGHFVRVIKAVRGLPREITIEVLTPDFKGVARDILTVLQAGPDVFNHNVETVPRMYKAVRPQADFERSLEVLRTAHDYRHATVKSGLMVGLGETVDELKEVFVALREAGVEMLTIGQYLSPSSHHHPVIKYYHPDEFTALAEDARRCGIGSVFAAPLVRSSYQAGRQYRSQ
jgi:lipoic acid synthetase